MLEFQTLTVVARFQAVFEESIQISLIGSAALAEKVPVTGLAAAWHS